MQITADEKDAWWAPANWNPPFFEELWNFTKLDNQWKNIEAESNASLLVVRCYSYGFHTGTGFPAALAAALLALFCAVAADACKKDARKKAPWPRNVSPKILHLKIISLTSDTSANRVNISLHLKIFQISSFFWWVHYLHIQIFILCKLLFLRRIAWVCSLVGSDGSAVFSDTQNGDILFRVVFSSFHIFIT